MRGNARGFSGIDTNRQIRTILMGGLSAQSASKWGLREVGSACTARRPAILFAVLEYAAEYREYKDSCTCFFGCLSDHSP